MTRTELIEKLEIEIEPQYGNYGLRIQLSREDEIENIAKRVAIDVLKELTSLD